MIVYLLFRFLWAVFVVLNANLCYADKMTYESSTEASKWHPRQVYQLCLSNVIVCSSSQSALLPRNTRWNFFPRCLYMLIPITHDQPTAACAK